MLTYIIDKWEFQYDPELTSNAYKEICSVFIWQCNCSSCQNFNVIREEIYPEQFKDLLKSLGINPEKEAEIYHIKKTGFKKHLYGGWFHFAGKFTKNDCPEKMFNLTESFQISLTDKVQLVPEILTKHPVLQLEFKTVIPWVIDKKEPK